MLAKLPFKPGNCGVMADTQAPTQTRGLFISECRQDTGSTLCSPQNRIHAIDLWPQAISNHYLWAYEQGLILAVFTTQLAQQLDGLFAAMPRTSGYADTYGYYPGWCALIWISTNGRQGGISEYTVSYVHLRRYEGLSPVGYSKSFLCFWQISLFQWKIVLVRD